MNERPSRDNRRREPQSSRINFQIVKKFWAIAKLYWFGEEKRRALGFLAIIIVMLVIYTYLGLQLNQARGDIFTALSQQDRDNFNSALLIYFGVLVIYVPLFTGVRYLIDLLGLFWREWLTGRFLRNYFSDRDYYRLTTHREIDNPDQRISQDIRSFTLEALFFFLIVISSVFEVVAFSAQLWGISPWLVGFLFIYALLGTLATIGIFGRALVRLNFEQLRREANFRFGLVRIRENAESIAFYQGERQESNQLRRVFGDVVENFKRLIIWRELGLGSFTLTYNFITFAIPFIVLAPQVLAGEMPVGQVEVARGAFFAVFSSLNIIVSRFQSLTEFGAGVERVYEFARFIGIDESVPAVETQRMMQPQIDTAVAPEIALEHVTLQTPNYVRTLVSDLSVSVPLTGGLLIMGASGSGKSSLLRAIAGLWSSGTGKIVRPSLDEMLFLPQRPYMVLGNLREQILYPSTENYLDDEELVRILHQVNLPHLLEDVGGLDAEENWSEVLSLGEQQRLAFSRILVNKPRYVILDEATSALDVDNEEGLYECLSGMDITYVSVGHRPTLRKYHHYILELSENQQWQLFETDDGTEPRLIKQGE